MTADEASVPSMHPTYMPFTESQLRAHFAPVVSGGDGERHLAYYRSSLSYALGERGVSPGATPAQVKQVAGLALQIEKDERFWGAAALLSAFHADDRVAALSALLERCLGAAGVVGFPTWAAALGGEQHLYFEANLPSPVSYRTWLEGNLDDHILTLSLLRQARGKGAKLEGATKVDAVLVTDTGFAVVFEAKVHSDCSPTTTHDVLRNQLARTIDVLLDRNPALSPALAGRDPERTCLVLLTPGVFKRNPSSRLYGWLYDGYKSDPALLAEHLPHRVGQDWQAVTGRLGWLTFEDCAELVPGSCGWLPVTADGPRA